MVFLWCSYGFPMVYQAGSITSTDRTYGGTWAPILYDPGNGSASQLADFQQEPWLQGGASKIAFSGFITPISLWFIGDLTI